jgi:hypothetical protein
VEVAENQNEARNAFEFTFLVIQLLILSSPSFERQPSVADSNGVVNARKEALLYQLLLFLTPTTPVACRRSMRNESKTIDDAVINGRSQFSPLHITRARHLI